MRRCRLFKKRSVAHKINTLPLNRRFSEFVFLLYLAGPSNVARRLMAGELRQPPVFDFRRAPKGQKREANVA
jgi:hypothetical protein